MDERNPEIATIDHDEMDDVEQLKRARSVAKILFAVFGVSLISLALMFFFYQVMPISMSQYFVWIPAFAIISASAIMFAMMFPHRVFYAFIGASMAMPLFFEDVSVGAGFMKLYLADFVFIFCAALLAFDLFNGKLHFRRIAFDKYVVLFFLVGLFGVYLGLFATGNRFDKVFGDYRRSFFYFANYFVALYLIRDKRDLRILLRVLLTASALTIPIGLVQLAMGKGYIRSPIDAAHVLSWMQCTFLCFSIYYGAAHLLYLPGVQTKRWASLVLLGILITIIANFRSSWLGIIFGFMGMFFFFPRAQKIKFVFVGIAVAFVIVMGMLVLWDQKIFENRTLGEEVARKADVGNTNIDLNVLWRYQSYDAAFRQISLHPILGSGLGTYLTFHIPTSRGSQTLALDHNVHNSFLWIFMSLGIPGILSLFAMHGYYLWSICSYLRHCSWARGKTTVMACGGYYVTAMTATFFQNYLEQAVTVTVLGTICAVTMLKIYYTPSRYMHKNNEGNVSSVSVPLA